MKTSVTVVCLAYNHEKWIEKCLDSILQQKTSFNFKVIVHDDCSTDGTADKLLQYRKYDNVELILGSVNKFSLGLRGLDILKSLELLGEVALCEGDDYWLDPFKLQKQYDIMRKFPDISLVVHDCLIDVGNTSHRKWIVNKGRRYFNLSDVLCTYGQFAPTASYYFSHEVLKHLPDDWKDDSSSGDSMIEILAMRLGRGYHISESMSVYRYNVQGSWTESVKNDVNKHVVFYTKYLRMLTKATKGTKIRCLPKYQIKFYYYRFKLSLYQIQQGDYSFYRTNQFVIRSFPFYLIFRFFKNG